MIFAWINPSENPKRGAWGDRNTSSLAFLPPKMQFVALVTPLLILRVFVPFKSSEVDRKWKQYFMP